MIRLRSGKDPLARWLERNQPAPRRMRWSTFLRGMFWQLERPLDGAHLSR